MVVLGVMLGGALGALCRYGTGLLLGGALRGAWSSFPLATLTVNVIGSFLLSLLIFSPQLNLSPGLKTAVGTGFIGSLTTFSTFEVETDALLRQGLLTFASFYVLGNLILGYLAVQLGRVAALRFAA